MSGNRGEGENFFSREKNFSPSPRTPHPLSKKAVFFLGLPLVAPGLDCYIRYLMRFVFLFLLIGFALELFASEPTLPADPLLEAARAGDVSSQLKLADQYFFGRNKRRVDLHLAAYWFRRAAESGNSYGVYELACCYENGRGVAKDPARAASLYKIAADAGNRYAQFMIGRCYEGGLGVTQDKYEAVRWYKKAGQGAGGFKYAAQRAKELQAELEKLVL